MTANYKTPHATTYVCPMPDTKAAIWSPPETAPRDMSSFLAPEQVDACFDGLTPSGNGKGRYDIARLIEDAVLASPQVQQALADSRRIDWLADAENTVGSVLLPTECVTANIDSLRAAIDAATRL